MCTLPEQVKSTREGGTQVILPRKGVLELARLLMDDDADIAIMIGSNHIRATTSDFTFTSKLVDGKFPDYQRVLPRSPDKILMGSRQELRQAFTRTAILSNEKYRGVRLKLTKDTSGILLPITPSRKRPRRRSRSNTREMRWKWGLTSAICWMCWAC